MTDLSTRLSKVSPEEADAFFATSAPELIVELIEATSDSDLAMLLSVDRLWQTAVRNVLGRLGEFAVPERLVAVAGIVEFIVHGPDGDRVSHSLRFDTRTVTVIPTGERLSDVTIETDALDFARLVSGGKNAALLLLSGKLSVKGDEALALQVGGVFQVPGQPGVAVDPAAVDPEEVAEALNHVKDAQLREVMGGGFRDVVIDQIFGRFPEFLDGDKAHKHTLAIGFKVTGRPDGDADRYLVSIRDGACQVEKGGEGHRDATLTVSGADFLKLVTGHLNPVMGVIRGTLHVKGDVTKALTLHKIMHIPGTS